MGVAIAKPPHSTFRAPERPRAALISRSSQSAVSWIPQAAELTGSDLIFPFSQRTDKYLSSSHLVSCTR
jgi:hypothetical protein